MINLKTVAQAMSSSATSTISLWRGTSVRPENIGKSFGGKPLTLYDMEGCPYCRLVREVLTELDLDVNIIPTAKGDKKARAALQAIGGKAQVPYLIDDNNNQAMYDSFQIINYLNQHYGNGSHINPLRYKMRLASSMATTALRPLRGIFFSGIHRPEQPLELYSFESSPFARLVRERLTELGLPYKLHNLGKQQLSDMGPANLRLILKPYQPLPDSKRAAMNEALGRVQVPYLIDANTGTAMFESKDIIAYLDKNYA